MREIESHIPAQLRDVLLSNEAKGAWMVTPVNVPSLAARDMASVKPGLQSG